MLEFKVDSARCVACGECVADCPARIIALSGGRPLIPADQEEKCYRCQHCLAVCPTGALSILGRHPDAEIPLDGGALPTAEAMATLLRGRRTVRRYRDENLPADTVRRLIETASHAPTGVNARKVRFTLLDDRLALAAFRRDTYDALERALAAAGNGSDDPRAERFGKIVDLWREKGVDTLFRGAPHFLVATAPADAPTPQADCLIALAYFELHARTLGVGTVWNGMMRWVIEEFAPELRARLAIPADHIFGYAMAFGPPAAAHRRTVSREPFEVVRIS